jgi:hypothetical protein
VGRSSRSFFPFTRPVMQLSPWLVLVSLVAILLRFLATLFMAFVEADFLEMAAPPVSSVRILEGSFLAKNGINPYCRPFVQSHPLLMLLFRFHPSNPSLQQLWYLVPDIFCALLILCIGNKCVKCSPQTSSSDQPPALTFFFRNVHMLAFLLFLFNPLSNLSYAANTTTHFQFIFLLILFSAMQSGFELSLRSYSTIFSRKLCFGCSLCRNCNIA